MSASKNCLSCGKDKFHFLGFDTGLGGVGALNIVVEGEAPIVVDEVLTSDKKLYTVRYAPHDVLSASLSIGNIEVNPDNWNLNWFHMAQDKGVFTVWIKEMPEGYSVNDIKQDTILMNGVLKPADVKIVGAEGKERIEIKFSKREGISYIGYIESGSKKKINISGQLTDEKWFIGEAEIEITGKQEHNRYQKRKKEK